MNIRLDKSEPIVDSLRMKDMLGALSDKRGKIARLIKDGALIQLRRGLYATQPDIHPYCFAASIYGPSYISFESALSFYGLIPEAVHEITSATIKRPALFANRFGYFRYLSIPRSVYTIGIDRIEESGIPFLIASPTKALCDRIAREPRMRSMSDVMKWAALMRLDGSLEIVPEVLDACARSYKSPSVRQLWRTVEKHGRIAT